MEPKYPADLQNVVTLLQKLSRVEAKYPIELLAQRRVAFLDKVSAVKVNPRIKTGKAHGGSHGGVPPAASQLLLQSFLVIILVAEIAIGAYVLRDKWLPLFRHPTPIPLPTYPLFQPTSAFAPVISTASAIPTGTAFPSATLVPGKIIAPTDSVLNPVVPETPQKEKPGKHLGQTPGPPETPSH